MLEYDHATRTLNPKVQTDLVVEAGSRTKDVRGLSGGEKSFSTICFLLSLWNAIMSPVRCLDEFDVFMDAVNRRVSMQLLMAMARQGNGTQFIFITPQNMNSVDVDGCYDKVVRLSDPDRNQATLD